VAAACLLPWLHAAPFGETVELASGWRMRSARPGLPAEVAVSGSLKPSGGDVVAELTKGAGRRGDSAGAL